MTYAIWGVSYRRNEVYLTEQERELFKPCASEIASLARQAAAARSGIRMPGVKHG